MRVTDDQQDLEAVALDAGKHLLAASWICSTAESCTGGLISKLLTDQPGSSAWFDHASITYSNDAKQRMLGVPGDLIEQFGTVSRECVESMAIGSVERGMTHIACSVSGVAGPDGGTPEKPVGTVWFAWAHRASPDAPIEVESGRCLFDGDRAAIRSLAAMEALSGIIRVCEERNR